MDNNDKRNENLNINLSAGDNKIKYYESTDNNCIFEILEDKDSNNEKNIMIQQATIVEGQKGILNDVIVNESENFQNENYKLKQTNLYSSNDDVEVNYGEISVKSILDCGEQEYIQGVKINLYKINGLSPVLIDSKVTDARGMVIFSGVVEGCYRVIEIIDKRYFEKPKYVKWNEITIDNINKTQNVIVINKIKKLAARNRYK